VLGSPYTCEEGSHPPSFETKPEHHTEPWKGGQTPSQSALPTVSSILPIPLATFGKGLEMVVLSLAPAQFDGRSPSYAGVSSAAKAASHLRIAAAR